MTLSLLFLLLFRVLAPEDEVPVGPTRISNFARAMSRGLGRARDVITLTPCERQKIANGGNYERLIAEQFGDFQFGQQRPAVIPTGSEQNIFCDCITRIWMICSIQVNRGEEENAIRARINVNQAAEDLAPFRVFEMGEFVNGFRAQRRMIVFTNGNCRVAAQIVITASEFSDSDGASEADSQFSEQTEPFPEHEQAQPRDSSPYHAWPDRFRIMQNLNLEPGSQLDLGKPPLRERQNSAPSRIAQSFVPDKFIPCRLCRDEAGHGECPLMLTDFKPFDVVYILKTDAAKVESGEAVVCISSQGLMTLSRTRQSRRDWGFVDPLKRTGERFLTVQDDFEAYVLFDDTMETCSIGPQSAPNIPIPPGFEKASFSNSDAASIPILSEVDSNSDDGSHGPYESLRATNLLHHHHYSNFLIFSLLFAISLTAHSSLKRRSSNVYTEFNDLA